MKLGIQNDLTLYINPDYIPFALIMSWIGFALLAVGFADDLRKKRNLLSKRPWDYVVVFVLILAFAVPPQTLSSATASRRPLVVPLHAKTSSGNCLDNPGDWELQTWVYVLGQYPESCYTGAPIALTGYVIPPRNNPLPHGYEYVGRLIISCCIVDAQEFALPVALGDETYPKDTWLQIRGSLQLATMNGKKYFVIRPVSVAKIEAPTNGQYQFSSPPPTVTPLPQPRLLPIAQ